MKKVIRKPNTVTRRSFMQKGGTMGAMFTLATKVVERTSEAAGAPLQQAKATIASRSFTGKRPEDYRVVLQDIGDPLTRMTWPPAPEKLVEASIGPLRGTAVNVYAYGIHHAGGTTHCSKVYPVVGDDQSTLRSASALRMNEAVKRLCDAGNDPLKVMGDGAHQAGIDYFLRFRMNDHHDRWGDAMGLDKPTALPKTSHIEPYFYTPKWKREHPEWLIGDPEAPHPKDSFKFMEAKAGNYAIGPFRELMYNLAAEAITGYDLDGFELDFFRSPFLFPYHEAYAQRYVMTAFVRRIRQLVLEQKTRLGHSVFLSARVPSTVELALRIGIDLPVWLKEGLLDMVVISNGLLPFSTPWKEIGDLASKAGIPALACFTYPRATVEGRESLRAATYRAFASGMSGIHLWNYFYAMPHYHDPGDKYLGLEFTHEIADRKGLATGSKCYLLDSSIHTNERLASTFGHAELPGQVPLMIGHSRDGISHGITFDIPDDLSTAGPKVRPQLWLRIVDLAPEDKILFSWNGQPIQSDPKAFAGITVFDSHEFRFELSHSDVRRGQNHLQIRLAERQRRLEPFVTLVQGRLTIPAL